MGSRIRASWHPTFSSLGYSSRCYLVGIAIALRFAVQADAQTKGRRFIVDVWSTENCLCTYPEIDPHTFNNPTYSAESRNDRGKVTDFYVNETTMPSRHLESQSYQFTDTGKPGSRIYSVAATLWCATGYLNSGVAHVKAYINGNLVAEVLVAGAAGQCLNGREACVPASASGTSNDQNPGPYDPPIDWYAPGQINQIKFTVDLDDNPYVSNETGGMRLDMVTIDVLEIPPPTIASVTFTTWKSGQNPGEANSADNGGGAAYVPERPDAAPASSAADYQILKIVADTKLPAGTTVFFRCYDPDDPTAATAPIDANDDTSPNTPSDNRDDPGNLDPRFVIGELRRLGTSPTPSTALTLPKVSAVVTKVGSGPSAKYQAVAYVRVPMQPGDNIVVVASTNDTELGGVRLDGQVVRTSSGYPLPTEASTASEQLFTWRFLRIRRDQMGVVSGNTQNGRIGEAIPDSQNPSKLYLWLVQTQDLRDAYDYYESWFPGLGLDPVYVRYSLSSGSGVLSARIPFSGLDSPPPAPPGQTGIYLVVDDATPIGSAYAELAGTPVVLNDDDDFACIVPDCTEGTTGNEGQLLIAQDLALLADSKSSDGNLLAPAFVRPRQISSDIDLAFAQNLSLLEATMLPSLRPDPLNSPAFWVANIALVFQEDASNDNDGSTVMKQSFYVDRALAFICLEHLHEIGTGDNPRPDIVTYFSTPNGVSLASGATVAGIAVLFGAQESGDDFVKCFSASNGADLPRPRALAAASIGAMRSTLQP